MNESVLPSIDEMVKQIFGMINTGQLSIAELALILLPFCAIMYFVYRWFRSGGMYYLKYPEAKKMDAAKKKQIEG